MKLKTFLQLLAVVAVLLALTLFLLETRNWDILTGRFFFLGFSFPVINGFVAVIVASMAAPAAYFTAKHLKLARETRALQKRINLGDAGREQLTRVHDLVQHGRYAKALELAEGKSDPEYLRPRAQAHLGLEQPEAAMADLRTAYEHHGDVAAGYLLAETLADVDGDPLPVLRAMVERFPDQAERAMQMILVHQSQGRDWAGCLETIRAMAAQGFDPPEGLALGCRYEWIREQPDMPPRKALERYQRLLKDVPDFVPAHLAMAEIHMTLGAEAKAFAIYEKAFETTGHPVFLDRLERYYLDRDRPEDAIQVYRELLVRIGGPMVKHQLGKLYFKLEMLDESLEMLEPLRGSLGHLPGYMYRLAEIKARRGRYQEAHEDMRAAVNALGFEGEDFACSECGARARDWRDQCPECGAWNAINLQAAEVSVEAIPANPISY